MFAMGRYNLEFFEIINGNVTPDKFNDFIENLIINMKNKSGNFSNKITLLMDNIYYHKHIKVMK